MSVSVLDPDLPSLATEAAVELDLLLNGVETTLSAVHQLGLRLKETTEPAGTEGTQALHVDTPTETLLGLAFTRLGDDPATVLGQLFDRTKEIAAQLSGAKQDAERKKLEWQRAFCLALSQLATAHRQFLFDLEPVHPDRR